MTKKIPDEQQHGVTESREFEERQAQILKVLNMDYDDPMRIDNKPDTMDYRWVRHTVLGDPSFSQVARAKHRGWTEVPAYRHPELISYDPNRPDQRNSWIENRGSILMERPCHYGDIERKKIDEFHYKQLMGAPGNSQFAQAAGLPLHVLKDEVSISRSERTFKE